MMQVSRRKIVKTLLALGACGVLPPYLSSFASDGVKVQVAGEGAASPFDVFRDVSAFVTLRDDLAPDAMAALYAVFKDEPWAPEHTDGLHKKIKTGIGKPRATFKDKSWNFTEGESWFAGHLLTTWYLGIYYHERLTKRVIYEDALMFSAARGIIPVPFLEPVGFGNWANPPDGHK